MVDGKLSGALLHGEGSQGCSDMRMSANFLLNVSVNRSTLSISAVNSDI